MLEFVLKYLQFTVHEWNDEKAAQLTFLQCQVCMPYIFSFTHTHTHTHIVVNGIWYQLWY